MLIPFELFKKKKKRLRSKEWSSDTSATLLQTEGVSPPFTARVPSSASAYDQRGLAPGQDYQVTVRALRGTSWGPPASKTITTSESWGWRGKISGFDRQLGVSLGWGLYQSKEDSLLSPLLSDSTSDRWSSGPPGGSCDPDHTGSQLAAPPG